MNEKAHPFFGIFIVIGVFKDCISCHSGEPGICDHCHYRHKDDSLSGEARYFRCLFYNTAKAYFFSVFFALGTTVSILVAQAYGKRDEREANYYFYTILKIAIIFSVVIGIITAVLAEPVMRICNHQDDTLHLSVSFFRIIMGFMIFQVLSTVLNAALRGIGKTKVTLVSNVAMGITDILFNYLLIEGRLGFPRLEIRGDAVATVLGSIAACVLSLL